MINMCEWQETPFLYTRISYFQFVMWTEWTRRRISMFHQSIDYKVLLYLYYIYSQSPFTFNLIQLQQSCHSTSTSDLHPKHEFRLHDHTIPYCQQLDTSHRFQDSNSFYSTSTHKQYTMISIYSFKRHVFKQDLNEEIDVELLIVREVVPNSRGLMWKRLSLVAWIAHV